jgi:hypothetical protein
MLPRSEMVHWWFAAGFLLLGMFLLAEAVVGEEIWRARRWRAYLFPGLLFALGVFMWPVMTFFTNSTIHMVAHGSWAQALMLAGASELGLARGKLTSPYWRLTTAVAFVVSGTAFLVHEQNPWLFQRSSFLHHALGWTLVIGSFIPFARAFRPRSTVLATGFALLFVAFAVMLFSDRDVAPVFGHLSQLAGQPHR